MNLTLKQIKSDFSSEYVLAKNDQTIAKVYQRDNLTPYGQIEFYAYFENCWLRLLYQPAVKTLIDTKSLESQVIYDIFDYNNNRIGSVTGKGWNFEYITIEYKNYTFHTYLVGLGKEGIKYPVYYNDQQVALIEKDRVVVNNLDEYNITSIDEFTGYISYIASLFIDVMCYSNRGEKAKKSYQKYYHKTIDKELKSKYNPDFKDYVNKNCI